MSKPQKDERKDPFDGEYIGNIWGWRLSLISAVMIVGLASFAAYRHYVLDVPLGFEDPLIEQAPAAADSTLQSEPTESIEE
jgi:predicted MFS family arabinose efflux permease